MADTGATKIEDLPAIKILRQADPEIRHELAWQTYAAQKGIDPRDVRMKYKKFAAMAAKGVDPVAVAEFYIVKNALGDEAAAAIKPVKKNRLQMAAQAKEEGRRKSLALSSDEPGAATADEEIRADMEARGVKLPKASQDPDPIGSQPYSPEGFAMLKVPSFRREILRGAGGVMTAGLTKVAERELEKAQEFGRMTGNETLANLGADYTATGAEDKKAQPGVRATSATVASMLPIGLGWQVTKGGAGLLGKVPHTSKISGGVLGGVGGAGGIAAVNALAEGDIAGLPSAVYKAMTDPDNALLGGGLGTLMGGAQKASAALRDPERRSGQIIEMVERAGGQPSLMPGRPVKATSKDSLFNNPLVKAARGKEGSFRAAGKVADQSLAQSKATGAKASDEYGSQLDEILASPAQAEKAAAAGEADKRAAQAAERFLELSPRGEIPGSAGTQPTAEAVKRAAEAEKAVKASLAKLRKYSKTGEEPPASNYPTPARKAYEEHMANLAARDAAKAELSQSTFGPWNPRPAMTQAAAADLDRAETARAAAHKDMTQVSRDVHGALDDAIAKNTTSYGVAADDAFQEALLKAKRMLGGQESNGTWKIPDTLNLQDLRKTRDAFKKAAGFESANPDAKQRAYRDAYDIVNDAMKAVDPAVAPMQAKYAETMGKLSKKHNLLIGQKSPKIDTENVNVKDKMTAAYNRLGDENVAGMKSSEHLQELRNLGPEEAKLVDTIGAVKAKQYLKIFGGEHSIPMEHIAHPKVGWIKESGTALGARAEPTLRKIAGSKSLIPLAEMVNRSKNPLIAAIKRRLGIDSGAPAYNEPQGEEHK